jgi:UDPglucose 6-dehydrogenase
VGAAAEDAEVVLHLTEWADYRAIDPAALAKVVARPVLIDARCTLDASQWRAAGWSVHVPGQPRQQRPQGTQNAWPASPRARRRQRAPAAG